MNNENFDLELNMDVENFNLTPNDEDEEFTVEFGEIFNDGGTHDYDELDNKPQINSYTLEGNKTGEQLGLQDKINDLSTIRSGAAKGATAVQPRDLARVATTGSYTDLNNKPTIPTVNDGTLTIQRNGSTVASFTANSSTNKTANISVPTATSQLTNDSGYTTNTGTITSVKMNGSTVATSGEANLGTVITDVSEKQNITDNTLETNSKTVPGAINEVNSVAKGANQALSFANYSAMITEFNSLTGDEYSVGQNIMVVTLEVPDLWISGIESTSSTYTYTTDEAFITAMATNGYVQVGYYKLSALETQKVDLTNYVTNTDYASNTTGGVVKTNINYGTSVDSNGSLRGTTKTYEDYGSMHNLGLISKVTLENVIEGKGLVSNTDYADAGIGGVIKTGASYGTTMSASGNLRAVNKNYEEYSSAGDYMLVGKGTLENVITGKGLVSNTDYASNATGGVIRTSNTYGTTVSGSGVLNASTLPYETYTEANDTTLVGKGTLENVITGKNLATKSDMPKYYYGTCATGASTRNKVVQCENFVLEEGATISVYFDNAQTYNGYPYLNVNNTGNITVLYKGGSAGVRYMWSAGEIIDFSYDGEYWICHGRALATTTYYGVTKLANSAISTSTSYALTPAVINAVAENMITGYPAYSAAATYAVGDRVRYSSYAYECNTAITTPESWTAAHWTAIDPLQTQIDALEARIRALENSQ